MAKGFKHGGSGGANPLNFTVKGFPSEGELNNATEKENTIGVVTTNDITGWYFSYKQPENMTDGEVWFSTGTTSSGKFNALKKNNIDVYPLSAKQRVNGALAAVKAKIFQNGKWADWITHYYVAGQGSKIGAWAALQQGGISHNNNRVEILTGSIHFIRGQVSWYNLAAQSPRVDLTNVTKLHFEYQCSCGHMYFGVNNWKMSNADGVDTSVCVMGTSSGREVITVDVTNVSEGYIVAFSYSNVIGEGWIYNVWGT